MQFLLLNLVLIILMNGCAPRPAKKTVTPLPSPVNTPTVTLQDLSEDEVRVLQQTLEQLRREAGSLDATDEILVQARILQAALEQHKLSHRVDAKLFLRLMDTFF